MNIGLVAHDSKKKLMQNFCIAYRGILSNNNLYATGTTGRLIDEVANLSVHKYLAGHLGGIQQLCCSQIGGKWYIMLITNTENTVYLRLVWLRL